MRRERVLDGVTWLARGLRLALVGLFLGGTLLPPAFADVQSHGTHCAGTAVADGDVAGQPPDHSDTPMLLSAHCVSHHLYCVYPSFSVANEPQHLWYAGATVTSPPSRTVSVEPHPPRTG